MKILTFITKIAFITKTAEGVFFYKPQHVMRQLGSIDKEQL